MAVFLVIFGRLIYLQVLKGDEYRQRSENNSVRLRKIRPVRGLIMDTKRRIIADSKPSFDLIYVPQKHGNVLQVLSKVAASISATVSLGSSRCPYPPRLQPFVPVRLERNLSWKKSR
jgi:penicillin-binding protein 2